MTEDDLLEGLIIKAQSGFFTVQTDHGPIVAQLRGRLTKARMETDVVALGDRVSIRVIPDESATIEEVKERDRILSRKAPGRDAEQVLVANPDQAVIVFACADPDPNFRMLDRLLVMTEREELPTLICANKIDLVKPKSAREEFGEYDALGYPVFYTSATTGKGVSKLRKALLGKLSVFAGPSGVGKSSILNVLQSDLDLRVREVSDYTGKGLHTTVVPELIPIGDGGWVADTPGLKAFALWDIEPDELDAYFREIRPLVADCEFSDCTHVHEPGCAVIAAVEGGAVSPERYDSYVRMRLGEEDLYY
ncbi:MAG: ribosome small subunit-dependent GTPase A [Anaerolineales bacterium]|nr:ribosome small subunit-dependent GTPase A [Anaerolineales bacterium]